MDGLHGVRVAGPLGPYVQGFAGELARLGYRGGPAQKHLRLAAQLSGWLADAGRGAVDLDAPVIDRYLAARRAAGYGEFVTPRALAPLLGYLRRLGVAPLPGVRCRGPRPRDCWMIIAAGCWPSEGCGRRSPAAI